MWAAQKKKHLNKPVEYHFAHAGEEIGEAFKEYRKGRLTTRREDGKLEGLPIELADVILTVCIIAEGFDIDLATAVEMKLSELEAATIKKEHL
jgi:NTP pyrophosphatase (non-canonical NTP hydrolase)